MEPTNNSWCNFVYRGPRQNIGDLPCRRETEHGMRVVRAYFKPSSDELKELIAGGSLCLSIYTEPIPPVSLGVVFTPEDYKTAAPATLPLPEPSLLDLLATDHELLEEVLARLDRLQASLESHKPSSRGETALDALKALLASPEMRQPFGGDKYQALKKRVLQAGDCSRGLTRE
jgi:hypothetical protein